MRAFLILTLLCSFPAVVQAEDFPLLGLSRPLNYITCRAQGATPGRYITINSFRGTSAQATSWLMTVHGGDRLEMLEAKALETPQSSSNEVLFRGTEFQLQLKRDALNQALVTQGNSTSVLDCEPNLHTVYRLFSR
jgi:hypothetical protein